MHVRAAVLSYVALLAGCAAGPNYHAPDMKAPERFAAAPADATAEATHDLEQWWHLLNDPRLDSLVERAVQSNPDVGIALQRLQQARNYEVVVAGHALPEVDATAAAGRGTGTDLMRSRAQQPLVSADSSQGLSHINTIAGFDTVWELDIFGKYRRAFEAARDDAQAAAQNRNAVIVSVIADVVRAYVDLRGLQVQAGIIARARDVLSESLRIVSIRYQRGITNELDEALARRELATLSARLEPVRAQVKAAEYTIATLIGDYPENLIQELDAPQLVPNVPGTLPAGLPVDLLRRRPDVLVAERQLAAANARIGVATANLFPEVSLVASIGSQSQGWGTLPQISQHIWSFGPGATWPLLDFGALDAQVEIAQLKRREQLESYRKTILGAVREVDTGLDGLAAQRDRVTQLDEALSAAQRAADLANQRYERGLTDFLNVVDAERQLYDLQEQYAAAQVAQGEQFVGLYKALGGGWQNYQDVPAIHTPAPAVIAAFRRTLARAEP